jgi:hypothetical protein
VSSLSQAALPRNKLGQIFRSSNQFKPGIAATLDKIHDIEWQVERRNDAVRAQGTVREYTKSPFQHSNDCPFRLQISAKVTPGSTLYNRPQNGGDEIIFVTRRMRLPCHRLGISLHSPSLAHKPLTRPRPYSD